METHPLACLLIAVDCGEEVLEHTSQPVAFHTFGSSLLQFLDLFGTVKQANVLAAAVRPENELAS